MNEALNNISCGILIGGVVYVLLGLTFWAMSSLDEKLVVPPPCSYVASTTRCAYSK